MIEYAHARRRRWRSVRRGAHFATTLAVLLLAMSVDMAAAQTREKQFRVGYLSPGSSSDPARLRRFDSFRQGLRELGYVEGQSIAIEPRWAEGKYDRYPALAADLVRLKVDAIVTVGGAATQAAKQATTTIPIVMFGRHRSAGGRARPEPRAARGERHGTVGDDRECRQAVGGAQGDRSKVLSRGRPLQSRQPGER